MGMDESLSGQIAAAGRAQRSVAARTLDERIESVHRSRAALDAAGPDIVARAVSEAGMPRKFAERELQSALLLLDALPDFADALRPRAVPAVSGSTTLEWHPYGVVLGLHAANSPVWVPTVVSMSALVAGNAVVCRPSRRVSATTSLVLEAVAGPWPAGAVQVVDCARDEVAGLLTASGIDAVVAHAATSTCTAHLRVLAHGYARGVVMRPYIAEASGNDALLVLPGADLAAAAAAIVLGAFAHAGQLCFSAKRIIVDAGLWPELVPRLIDASTRVVIGDPDDPRTDLPARLAADQSVAEDACARAIDAGGQLVLGRPVRHGETSPRLVLLPRERLGELALWREEIFAPIRGVVLADGVEDAIGLAADTRFGIGVSVFGGQPEDHARIGCELRVGRILVNESPLYQDPRLVVGGVRDSGFGGARPKLEQLVYARRVHSAAVSSVSESSETASTLRILHDG
jgi:acyl-CoA reductase-like NAD-dependent aldehyde dehydrogenase